MHTPDEILTFWLEDVGPKGWYAVDPALDQHIVDSFGETWQEAREGAFGTWLTGARDALAYIILTDQFSRNMFRGHADAFATDRNARAAAKMAINKKWDMRIDAPARQFFYMPLMHSESLVDQDRAVRLIWKRMPDNGGNTLLHARAHRRVIRSFGRFPFRNDALGRANTKDEEKFMADGAYMQVVRDIQAEENS